MYANEAMTIVQWEGVENISMASMNWAGAEMISEMFVLSIFSLHRNGSAITVSAWCDRYLWPVQFPARPFRLRFVGNDLPIRWLQFSGIYHFVVPNKTILLISLIFPFWVWLRAKKIIHKFTKNKTCDEIMLINEFSFGICVAVKRPLCAKFATHISLPYHTNAHTFVWMTISLLKREEHRQPHTRTRNANVDACVNAIHV